MMDCFLCTTVVFWGSTHLWEVAGNILCCSFLLKCTTKHVNHVFYVLLVLAVFNSCRFSRLLKGCWMNCCPLSPLPLTLFAELQVHVKNEYNKSKIILASDSKCPDIIGVRWNAALL